MKKILIATDSYLPRLDGVSRFLSEIISRLKQKYKITLLAPDLGNIEEEQEGFELIRFPVKNTKYGDIQFANVDNEIIENSVKKCDVVFAQSIGPIGGNAISFAQKLKKPAVAYIHAIDYELASKAMSKMMKKIAYIWVKSRAKRLYKKCRLLIVPSENIEELLQWQKIYTPMKIVHLGVNTEKFCPPESKAQSKKEIGIDECCFLVGYHGRLAREKDLITLFRAFIRLQSKYPKTQLILVGDGLDEVKEIFEKRKGCQVISQKKDVEKYVQAMDVYVLTSLTETTSLSTLEAMSCGVPVVATKVGFVKDYIVQGINGLLIDSGQAYQLAKKIELLINNPLLREKISKNARLTVEQKFNWDRTVKEIEAILEKA